ncbi:MAG: sigma-70 family RNA polymerase sigma factor [Thermoguttaceae bacterium]
MALSEIDRNLLERCLQQKPRAWEDFVDRFMGLMIHVVNHTAQSRGLQLTPEDRDDLCASVFLVIVENDLAVLRNFRRQCSLATYLTVVVRRIVVRELQARKPAEHLPISTEEIYALSSNYPYPSVEQRVMDEEEIARMLSSLKGIEAEVVRMFHLEGKTYQEISMQIGMAENSIGPILSRARDKLRHAGVNHVIK